mgnify:CR=1 FL=1
MKTVIFDIDGTLADDSHRLHFVESKPKDYKQYNDLMHMDTVKPEVKALLEQYHKVGYVVKLITGRWERHRDVTEKWLFENGIFHDGLTMRQDEDFRCGTIVKREELNKLRQEGHNVVAAFEDRNKLINMFREEGVTCFAVENRSQ